MSRIEYNPFWDDVIDDPWPTYARMREERPACYVEELDGWALSRHADITKVSMNRSDYTITHGSTLTSLASPLGTREDRMAMFMQMDPPRHTPYRAVLSPHFTPRRFKQVEPVVRGIVAQYIEPLLEKGAFDAVVDLARLVSSHVTCVLLGLPPEDAPDIRDFVTRSQRWIHDRPAATPEEQASAGSGMVDLTAYLIGRVAERRVRGVGGNDILQAFLEARPEGRALTDPEIAVHLSGLVIGGIETLPKHFGSLMVLLHGHPEQRAKVVADPELSKNAVEEALRFDAPTHVLGRRVVNPVELHGEQLVPGQPILLLYASGNRDRRAFDDAEVFDIERKPGRIVTFGAGIHLCMGLHIARLESRLMLEGILRAGPEYELRPGVERCRLAGIHGYDQVPIEL